MKRIAILFSSLLLLAGCDVLDKQPLPSITPENFFTNADDAEAAITAAYDAMQVAGYYGQDANVIGEMPSDNCTSTNGDVNAMERIIWTPQTGQVNNYFQNLYISINRANAVLKYVPAITMDTARRNQIVGEAYFLRGLHYFNLVRLYGGVPLRLEPTESGESSIVTLARSTPEQIYTQITADLQQAERLTAADLGGQAQNRARAIKTTVNALQARVFLTQQRWADAATAASKVLSSSLYQLSPTFKGLYPPDNNPESIFEIQYSGNADGGFVLPDLVLPSPPATYSYPKFNIPTTELIERYADTLTDLRYKFTGQVTSAGRDHASYVKATSMNVNDNGYFVYKWTSNPNAFNSPDNYYVLRLADVYLMYAEAINEQSGPTQQALNRLNTVRTRAGLPALTLADLTTQQAFRNEVDRQRRLELAFEGERWFDLIRYARHAQTGTGVSHAVTALDIIQQQRGTRDANYLLFPIPQNEINNNPLLQQNPGY
ncbi:RagB/SusD family nutrient uptake outer membrane protein [Spirosoma sp. KUDC1026]|uniref:RagB/SusD family nutrient uptake outer membrane protein n=1 Tax=Spirosoma sp. KUDC1026 TaxID=2745947 RepID=UPI00159BA2B2|nr:RagB/SusD family nutrient uptake outer membrane protein [Spirosoma sp. KUDC1026]QKZ11210.1 RagB/SusD family nutrient uptake outer membrane protein [Spirosoma sp. KUDC1026]